MERLIGAYRKAGLLETDLLTLRLQHYSNGFTLLQHFRDEQAMNACYRVANRSGVFENIFNYTNSTVNGSIYTEDYITNEAFATADQWYNRTLLWEILWDPYMFGTPIFGWVNDFTPNATYDNNGTLVQTPVSGTKIVVNEVYRYVNDSMEYRAEANKLYDKRFKYLKKKKVWGPKQLGSYDLEWIPAGFTHTTVFDNMAQFQKYEAAMTSWKPQERLDNITKRVSGYAVANEKYFTPKMIELYNMTAFEFEMIEGQMDPLVLGDPFFGFEYTRFSKAIYLAPLIDIGIGVYFFITYQGQYVDVYDPDNQEYLNPWGNAYWLQMSLGGLFMILYTLVYIVQPSDQSFLRIVLTYAMADLVNAFQVTYAYFWMMSTNAWYADMFTTHLVATVTAFSAIGVHLLLLLFNALYFRGYQKKIKRNSSVSSVSFVGEKSDFDFFVFDPAEASELDL